MLSAFYCLLSVPTVFYSFCSQACSQIGRSKRIKGQQYRLVLSVTRKLAPPFTARYCSQYSTSLNSARFLLLHFTPTTSVTLSRKTTKINCLSPSLGRSSHTLPSVLAVPPSGNAPLFLVPPFVKLFLFPGNLSSPAASPATWRISRIPSVLGVNQFVAPPCAPHRHSVPPHFGPPGLVLPGPRSALSRSPYKGSKTAFSWHHFSNLFAHSLLVTFPAYRQHATFRQ
jgi:hypothetical protein